MGKPPTNSIANTTGIHTITPPSCGWIATSKTGGPAMTPQISSVSMGCIRRYSLNNSATIRMPARMASCDGCRLKPPNSSQLFAPKCVLPMNLHSKSKVRPRM